MFKSFYTINALNPSAMVECLCPPHILMVLVPNEILWGGASGRRVGQEVGVPMKGTIILIKEAAKFASPLSSYEDRVKGADQEEDPD